MSKERVICHVLMALAFVFLVATRYMLYVSMSTEIGTKAIGANLSYLIIWAFAYWLAITSNKIVTNSIIGLFAVLLAPSLMPLVGYVLLIVMYIIRKIKPRSRVEQC